jgi:hypothetical protein
MKNQGEASTLRPGLSDAGPCQKWIFFIPISVLFLAFRYPNLK